MGSEVRFLESYRCRVVVKYVRCVLLLNVGPFFFQGLLARETAPTSAEIVIGTSASAILASACIRAGDPNFAIRSIGDYFSIIDEGLVYFFVGEVGPFGSVLCHAEFFRSCSPPVSSGKLLVPDEILLLA